MAVPMPTWTKVTLSVDKKLRKRMAKFDRSVNWSELFADSVAELLDELDADPDRAKEIYQLRRAKRLVERSGR